MGAADGLEFVPEERTDLGSSVGFHEGYNDGKLVGSIDGVLLG